MESNAPIMVVGAGPTGLTMACELARHGAPVRIIDKLAGINPHCRATGIHARTLEIFCDFGIVDEIVEKGVKITGTSQYYAGKRFMHSSGAEIDSPYPFAVSIEQCKTEAVLEALLNSHGIGVERETELIALAQDGEGVRATIRRPDGREEVVSTPWLIGCDGAHSRVRHLNRLHFPGDEDPRQYLLAHLEMDAALERDEVHFFFSDRGILLIFPLPERHWLAVCDLPAHHDAEREHPSLDEIRAIIAERGPSGITFGEVRWTSYFRINYRSARHYRHGRIFLAGDAVHVHSPMGGLGMNTGIQDAYNLGWKLAMVGRGRAADRLLDSYEKERRPVAEDVVKVTRMMTERFEAFAGLSPAQRESLYFNLAVPPEVAHQMARHVEELDLDYSKSPICREHLDGAGAIGSGPRAGEQAPDARPLMVNGSAASLYQIIRGPRHTLLLFAGVRAREDSWRRLAEVARWVRSSRWADGVEVWLAAAESGASGETQGEMRVIADPGRRLHLRYGAESECLYLVRPDGYVGYRAAGAETGPLREYLEHVFGK